MTLIVKRHNNSVKLIGPLVCALICFTTMIGLFNSMSHAMLWDGWLLLLVRILLFSWAVINYAHEFQLALSMSVYLTDDLW